MTHKVTIISERERKRGGQIYNEEAFTEVNRNVEREGNRQSLEEKPRVRHRREKKGVVPSHFSSFFLSFPSSLAIFSHLHGPLYRLQHGHSHLWEALFRGSLSWFLYISGLSQLFHRSSYYFSILILFPALFLFFSIFPYTFLYYFNFSSSFSQNFKCYFFTSFPSNL